MRQVEGGHSCGSESWRKRQGTSKYTPPRVESPLSHYLQGFHRKVMRVIRRSRF